MKFETKLHGFEEFDRLLKDLGPRVGNRVLQGAVTGAIREGAKEIRKVAPQHLDKQSPASKKYGPLRKNIKVKRLRRVRPGEKAARVDTGNAFWGVMYELGTRHQPARPWFANAFRKARENIIKNLADRLKKGIEKEATK